MLSKDISIKHHLQSSKTNATLIPSEGLKILTSGSIFMAAAAFLSSG